MHSRKCLPVAVLAVTAILASTSCRPSQTLERQTDDAAIEAKIKAKLATEVGATTITSVEVNVTNGVVTLAGPVKTQDEKQRIEAVARGIEGVTSVTNNIQVSGADVPAPQPPSTSTWTSSGDSPIFVPFPTPTPVP